MIENLNDLKKLLQLCRKQGVTDIELGSVKIKLGELPIENISARADLSEDSDSDNPYAKFPDGVLSPEQLIYYSSGGLPENDPALVGAEQ